MNRHIRRLDDRIRQITSATDKEVIHIRNRFTNTLRQYDGDMYDMDLMLASEPYRLCYLYWTYLEFSACGYDFRIDIVID